MFRLLLDFFKELKMFKQSGFNYERYKRMEEPQNTKAKQNITCVECGTIYNYPYKEVELKLTSPIPPLSFCSRKCYDTFMIRK